jgi:threonylcarbamoyladenosine tRNA methylthiotransferase MtaB
MARRCFTDDYRALVDAARHHIENLSLTTDVIVGFPGETEEEWSQTLAFIEEISFAHMHIFTYSPREGTRAAKLPGRVTKEMKRLRSRELHALGAQMKRTHLERFVGQTQSVLWESGGDPIDNVRLWQGYTDNFLRVQTSAPAEMNLENMMMPARLETCDGEKLYGSIEASPQGGKAPGN